MNWDDDAFSGRDEEFEEDDPGFLDLYTCNTCKGEWWLKCYEELPDINLPRFCPHCGLELDWILEGGCDETES